MCVWLDRYHGWPVVVSRILLFFFLFLCGLLFARPKFSRPTCFVWSFHLVFGLFPLLSFDSVFFFIVLRRWSRWCPSRRDWDAHARDAQWHFEMWRLVHGSDKWPIVWFLSCATKRIRALTEYGLSNNIVNWIITATIEWLAVPLKCEWQTTYDRGSGVSHSHGKWKIESTQCSFEYETRFARTEGIQTIARAKKVSSPANGSCVNRQ